MVILTSYLARLGLAALSLNLALSAHAYPANLTSPNYDAQLLRRADPREFYLRIMPLGASITAGDPSPPDDDSNNGYRKFLRDKLRSEGWKVNMVGNSRRGKMNDNDHEGVGGQRLDAVRERGKPSVRRWLPNVVLINAGTNDATQVNDQAEPIAEAGLRMRRLIDAVFAESPGVVVVLSTLLPNTRTLSNGVNAQRNVDSINEQIRQVYQTYAASNRDEANPAFRVILAEMAGYISPDELFDRTHPQVIGQRKMAAVWDWAINEANRKGWLTEPTESGKFTDGEGTTTCKKELESGNEDPRGQVQVLYAGNSLIRDDGKYIHDVQGRDDRVVEFKGSDSGNRNQGRIFFAQLVNSGGAPKGGELDEAIFFTDDTGNRRVEMAVNKGDGEMGEKVKIDIPDKCKTRGIRWGDVNGDGLDDFICISPAGEMYVTLNRGGNPPKWENIGRYKGITDGADQDHVKLGDIDGDGRLDFCTIRDNGDLYCYRNGGLGDRPEYWQDMGKGKPIFTGKNKGDIKGVNLVDVNGDGRSDWIWMDKEGKVETWINHRGVSKTMIPSWQDAGVTHLGVHENIGDHREWIQWGRIFGSGRFDYMHLKRGRCEYAGDGPCHLSYRPYQNLGKGGKFQKGDGIYWGDTTGSGFDDYIWISPEGEVSVFVNKYTSGQFPDYKTSAWTKTFTFNTGVNRRGLHVGDWDGDGKADIIAVTDRKSGALKVWHSRWDGTSFNWDARVIPNSAKCDQGWGLMYYDHGAYFADITGSGRVDYICMEPNGRATAWIRNDKGDWYDAKQIKSTEGLDRANFRFADVDGDGRADLLWVDKFSGDATVWYNGGQVPEADRGKERDSLFHWDKSGRLYLGSHRGPNMYYPNLGGQRRADQVGSNPITGHAWVWFNSCPAGGDDVEGDVPDPGLPGYTPPDEPSEPPETGNGGWFCGGNGGTWSPALWNQHNVGDWFLQRCEFYTSLDGSWPEEVDGIPRVIAQYDGQKKDGAWNWPPGCITITGSECGLTDDALTSKDTCTAQPERAFSLFAMMNFAKVLRKWYNNFHQGVTNAALFTPEIAKGFFWREADASPANSAAWLTIIAGLFTTIGSIIPVTSVPANSVAGIITAGAGTASFFSAGQVEDLAFSDFSELQGSLGRMSRRVELAMSEYYSEMLAKLPPDNDRELGTALARMLQDGAFADQDILIEPELANPGDSGPWAITTSVTASIIAEAWNSGSVIIAKWTRTGAMADFWDPCGRDARDRHGVDHAIACQFDNNYVITPIVHNGLSMKQRGTVQYWPRINQYETRLRDYNLTHADIITAAKHTQDFTGEFMSRNMDNTEKFLMEAINNPLDGLGRSLAFFNVPYCDLDAVAIDESGFNNCYRRGTFDQETYQRCLNGMISEHCQKYTHNGQAWPYKHTW